MAVHVEARQHKNNILKLLLVNSTFSILHITTRTILTQYQKVKD